MSLKILHDILTSPIINTLFAICGLIIAAKAYRVAVRTFWYPTREKQKDRHLLNKNLGQGPYDTVTIKRLTEHYIRPKFSNIDPTQEKEIGHAPTITTEDSFEEVNRFLDKDCGYRHLLILAESGFGKTSFTLNYYAYNLRKRKEAHKILLIPLGRKDADSLIAKIPDKKEWVIFLDALDEDTNAIDNHHQRISNLMATCKAFKRVIITCRTQFFSKNEKIPVETGVIRIVPRQAGEKDMYEFRKLYLALFDDKDVAHYIKQRYHFWAHGHRKKAFELVGKIPLLTVRPMLLAHIHDIIKRGVEIETSYQLYEVMVEAWLDRESGWVDKEVLRTFSEQLAVNLFVNRKTRGQEQVTKEELSQLTQQWGLSLEGWKLRGRSLLNQDAAGNYKFAHRSIMEFLFVKRWLKDDKQARQVVLTDQMGKFLTEVYLNEANLHGVNLSRVNLSGVNLRSVNLSGVNLRRANLSGTNLSGADLRGTDLSGADLRRVNFSGVNLSRMNLSSVNLRGANLRRADLCETNLSGADLRGTNLSGANLQKTKIDNTTKIDTKWKLAWKVINHKTEDRNFFKADLSGANLSEMNLRGANLRRADLSGADLNGTNLIGADLERADLSGTNLIKTNLSGVNHSWMDLSGTNLCRTNLSRTNLSGMDLRGMDLHGANLRRAELIKADLRRANLNGADLSGANLCRADLRGTNLRGMDLREVNLRGANLRRADLRRTDLSGANLSGVNLSGMDLRRADLSGANLSRADLRGTNLSGTNLSGANLSETNLSGAKHDYTTKWLKSFDLSTS